MKPHGGKVTIVQPGPFRTDFVQKSLEPAAESQEAYAATSGRFAKLIGSMHGKQPGNPELAAQAILQAVAAEKPPLRLILGKYAQNKAKQRLAEREQERAVWEEIGKNTDF
jgi:NAD(P)-dependent dehydrogenase (short-subunit alcohol dehydrogenase family)